MAFDERKEASIRRMAVQKSACEIVTLGIQTSVVQVEDFSGLLAKVREVIDYLDADVVDAGDRAAGTKPLTSGNGAASLGVEGVQDGLSLDEAMDLLDRVSALAPDDRAKVKDKLASVGATNLHSPKDAILGLRHKQADEVYRFLKEGLKSSD